MSPLNQNIPTVHSLRFYAKKYGVAHMTISKIKAEGIDLNDEFAVKERLLTKKIIEKAERAYIPKNSLSVPKPVPGKGLRQSIERLREAELAAYNDYTEALKSDPKAVYGRLKIWLGNVESLRKGEMEISSVEKENGESISKTEFTAILSELFSNLRMDLDSLPRKIGLAAGNKRDEVIKTAEEEKDRIIESLASCRYLKS